jgi:hypothetical protein
MIFGAAPMAVAHLRPNSLSIQGGETFAPGQKVTVTWGIDESHGALMISFSNAGGGNGTWVTVASNLPAGSDNSTASYEWTVADDVTVQGKLRVFQNGGGSGPANVSNTYNLVSGTFSIQSANPVIFAGVENGFALRQSGETLELHLGRSGFTRADLSGLNGVILGTYRFSGSEGQHPLVFSTRNLPPGKAVLRVFGPGLAPLHRVLWIKP